MTPGIDRALRQRGLEPELAQSVGFTAGRNAAGEYLAMPYFREGKLVNNRYRTLGREKRFWQDKGGAQCPWNEDCLRDEQLVGQPLVITEGEMDALAVLQSGFTRKVISAPNGAPPGEKPGEMTAAQREAARQTRVARYAWIDEIRSLLTRDRCPVVILATDGDGPGATLLQDLANLLGRFRCKYVVYPKHPQNRQARLKDLNEVLVHFGERGVVATLERAPFLKVDGVMLMSDLPPLPPSVAFEFPRPILCNHWKLRLGDISVVTGIPSHGKSSLINDLCCGLADRYGVGTAWASFEQSPQRDHRRNLRTWYLKKPVEYAVQEELDAADHWIDESFVFMVPSEDDDVTLEWVLEKAEAAVVQWGAKVVVIDPWNEMDHSRDRSESLTEYTGRAIKALRRFARAFQAHVIIVAHPAKMRKNDDGQYSVPTLYDVSDSAHWYNKADVGVVVHRTSATETLVRVAKSRYREETGEPGDVATRFNFTQRRFEVIPPVGSIDYRDATDPA